MALIKFGGGVVGMAGSIAGTTFARNRYGSYARARTKPINPNTALQQLVRSALSQLTTRWAQTLTADQRTAWNLYGANVVMQNRLGESINLSGFNHYLRSNAWFASMGLTPVDDGPTVFELPDADPTFAITASEATQNITTTYDDGLAWATETGGYLLTYNGSPQNPQRNFFGGPWRFQTAVAGVDAAPPAPPKIAPATFAITELQRMWCYSRILRKDGRLSAPFRAHVFIGA